MHQGKVYRGKISFPEEMETLRVEHMPWNDPSVNHCWRKSFEIELVLIFLGMQQQVNWDALRKD